MEKSRTQFTSEEAEQIGRQLGIDWSKFNVEQFRRGLGVELEHGLADQQTNVTNNDPLITGKIALAHLNEFPDYYTRLEEMEKQAKEGLVSIEHYYGDLIRKFFLVGAAVMVIGLPFVGQYIPLPTFSSILAILLLGVTAGLTSPRYRYATVINAGVSIIAFIVFESYAIKFFYADKAFFFVINQGLSLLFLAAIYYSTKTWRGMFKK